MDINSQSFKSLGTKTTYISIDDTIKKINDYNESLANDVVLAGIAHMHKNNNGGYSGSINTICIQ